MSTIIGRVRPVFRGEWDPAAAYAALDMVRSADGQASYTALKDVPAGTALSDATYWDKIVDMTSSAARPLPATAEGNPAQIWPDAGSALRPVTTLAPVQSGSGDPSPDNVRPISGWTGVGLTRCGKNLLPPAVEKTIVNNGVTFTSDGQGRYTINGTATGGNAEVAIYLVEPITIGKVAPYCHLLNPVANGSISFSFYRPNGTQITYFATSSVNRIAQIPLLAGETISRINLYLAKDKTADNFTLTPMLCTDDTPATFEPYQGNAYTAEFGQMVYGGTLDWKTGVLTVTHGQIAAYAGESLPGAWISDRDVYAPGTAPTTGAQVVYELATPTAIQLTPQQIAALPGLNTLFTNGDGLSVGYSKSIAKMFEEVLALIPAASGA